MTAFGPRLLTALRARGPLCVGIDPHESLLHGWRLPDDAGGLEQFARTCVDALAGEVAVLKPQSAFFERFGSAGIAVLERVIADARSAGALVIVDAKRGDIGSTMDAYASAYADPASPLAGDAVTVTPYVGFGALRPILDTAIACGTGVLVLAATSNPEGAGVQRALCADGRSVGQSIVDRVAACNVGAERLGSIGVVVGATIGDLGLDLAALHGPILVPGLGAQGGTAAGIGKAFGGLPGVVASTSRGILAAGPDPTRLRDAARGQLDDLLAAGV
ncbi:MAG: orotidine-5'-phosphate decarboxylase [Mycobacteriales bacterium]